MEIKWMVIGLVAIFAMMSVGMALEQYEDSQCKIAGFNAGKDATEIAILCK